MIIYFVSMFFVLILGLLYERHFEYRSLLLWFCFFFLLFIFGFRYQVGVDWYSYILFYHRQVDSAVFFDTYEVGYKLLNLLGFWSGLGMSLVIFLTTMLILFFTLLGARRFDINPLYFLSLSFPYHFVMSGMNFNRQAIALSFFVLVISYLFERKRALGLFFLMLGSLFHVSLLVFAPLFFIGIKKRYILSILLLFCGGLIFFLFSHFGHYIDSSMDNSGLYLRALFLLIPSVFVLLHYNHWKASDVELKRVLILVIFSFPCLIVLSFLSTTLADRLSYYFIILNLMVWLRIEKELPKDVMYFNVYTLPIVFISSFVAFLIWTLFSSYIDSYEFKYLPFVNIL